MGGQLNWRTLGFGLLFGTLDSIALPIVKGVHNGLSSLWMIVPVLIYATTPFVFLKALEKETMTIMNLVWDLTSDLVVTFIGLVVFAESVSPVKAVGIGFSLIGLFLMSYEGNGWNETIASNVKKVRNAFTV
jgi:multidrug transporter EmrE-like cation transporter